MLKKALSFNTASKCGLMFNDYMIRRFPDEFQNEELIQILFV